MKNVKAEHVAVWMMMLQTAVIVAAVIFTNFRFDVTPGDLLRKLDAIEAKIDVSNDQINDLHAEIQSNLAPNALDTK